MQTYNSDLTVVTVNGVPLSGLATDSIVSISTVDRWTPRTGLRGAHVRSKAHGDAPTATVTLLRSSLSNELLSTIAENDERTGLGVFAFQVFEGSSGNTFFSRTAYIIEEPEVGIGGAIGDMVWTVCMPNMTKKVGGIADV